jgi:hypothetical protein
VRLSPEQTTNPNRGIRIDQGISPELEVRLRNQPFIPALLPLLLLIFCSAPAGAQQIDDSKVILPGNSSVGGNRVASFRSNTVRLNAPKGVATDAALPAAPEPAADDEPANVPWAAKEHQQPFSRIGIGADVSPLGIGIKSATVLTQYFDARLMGNFFNYNSGQFELEGFRVKANLHMASAAASLDWYPLNSIWRLSVGTLFYNGNQLSATSEIVPGTSFSLNGEHFYSATANPITGATPVTGSGVLGLHRYRPAFTLAGGFGKFIPRSDRHWSFPSEFGVAFTGAPTVNVNLGGWVCLDQAQTQCSNLSDSASPVTVQFNDALQASLTKWRKDLSAVEVYPLFSYSVVYSFNIR